MTRNNAREAPRPSRSEDGIARAVKYLSISPEIIVSLKRELSTVVGLCVPDFSDACFIDLFKRDGCSEQVAKVGCDQLIATALAVLLAPSHCLRLPLTDGMQCLGVIQFVRAPLERGFAVDERLDARVLASRISTRIQKTDAPNRRKMSRGKTADSGSPATKTSSDSP